MTITSNPQPSLRLRRLISSPPDPTSQTDRPATLTPAALARRWGCSTATLANRRSLGLGPAYVKPVGRIVYLLSDVEEYEAKTRVSAA